MAASRSARDKLRLGIARTCANYSVSNNGVNYGDWYLPSKFELNLLYLQKNLVGSFASDDVYFSSTEVDSTNVWVQWSSVIKCEIKIHEQFRMLL